MAQVLSPLIVTAKFGPRPLPLKRMTRTRSSVQVPTEEWMDQILGSLGLFLRILSGNRPKRARLCKFEGGGGLRCPNRKLAITTICSLYAPTEACASPVIGELFLVLSRELLRGGNCVRFLRLSCNKKERPENIGAFERFEIAG